MMGWGGVEGLITSCVCIRTDASSYGIKDTSCYGCYVGCTSARYGCYVGGDMSNQNVVKIRLVDSHFAEEKEWHFCKHWTHTTTRNPCNCDDLSVTYTSSKCHFDPRRNMSREPSFCCCCCCCCCCWEAAPTVPWEKKKINHPNDNVSFNMSSKSMGLPISRKLFGLGQERWKTKKKMIVKHLNRKHIKNATHA